MPKLASGRQVHAVFFAASKLQKTLSGVMDHVHQQTGMASSQRFALLRLRESGPATVPDLARARGVSRQFVQTVVNDLLGAGLVELLENPRHKRSKLVAITNMGCKALASACQKENDYLAQAFSDLESADVEAALHVLSVLQKRTEQLRTQLAKENCD